MNCIATFARLSRSASGEKCRSYLALAPLATTGVAIASSAALTYEGSDQQPTERADNFTEVRLILNQTRFNRKNFNAVCEAPLATGKNETLTPKEHREETEEERFERVLAYHRSKIETYRSDWEYKAQNSGSTSSVSTATKTPSRTWPDGIPSNGDLSYLLEDLKYCVRSPNFRSDKEYCHKLSFRVAAALLQQFEEETQKRGFDLLKSLAEIGYPDAMVFYGMCLNDGRAGTDPNPEQAVVWFRRCADMYEHPQAQYELGVALYTGEGVVENEEEAIKWFRLASEQNHPAACYMLGDCLLDGSGVEIDRGAALEWLIRSSELGHRGARSRVMAVLEKKEGEDYGRFTDASRQTLKEHVLHSVDNQGRKIQRRATRRRSTSPRNPAELARRQTIVSNSRRDTVAKE